MNGNKAELLLTDPPYSSGGSQESGKTTGSIGARGGHTIKNDNLSTRGYRLLMQDVLALCSDVHSVFIFCDWKMWIETFDISERSGFRVRNMIVWDKMQMGMGMPFRNQHELCLFASKIAGKIGDGATPNVLQHKRDREAEHKTPKPIELLSDLLKQIESINVFDPFLGGGSTMVAAHQLKRKCYGMELDPKYCDVIVKRMVKLDPTLVIKRNGEVTKEFNETK
jgi:DNA modification methylase